MAATPATEILRDYVVVQRADLERDLPRLDDVESVHRVRTRARRVRSVLAAYDELTPRSRLGRDLRWLGRTVGALRDLDIIRSRVTGVDLVPHLLDHERARALADARGALAGDRGHHLVRGLTELGRADVWADLPRLTLADVAPRVLGAERERVLRRDRLAAQAGPDRPSRLHDVRKAAKRLRYAAEPAGHSELAIRAQTVQDLLGSGNDAILTAAWLDRAARAHPAVADALRAESERQWSEAHLDDAAYTSAIGALRDTEL
ncbi:MAG: CHAD domain-containing protein [Nocardioides sp.]